MNTSGTVLIYTISRGELMFGLPETITAGPHMFDVILIAVGFAGLLLGGNWMVDGAVNLARRMGISPMVIGLTLVGFGTSLPELFTSVQAALAGSPGIAIGNVIGSNIANILLILGLTCAITPMVVDARALRRDGSVMLAATAVAIGLVLWGDVTRPMGAALVLGLIAYIVVTLRSDRGVDIPETGGPDTPFWRSLVALLVGLAVTILAAGALVRGAVNIAASLGVSEALIGVTIVAVGTSLPELMTSLIAARRGQIDMALGNIIGSNIFNILGILGVTAVVQPMVAPAQFAGFDIWVMGAATLALLVMARSGLRISRGEGALLLGGYLAYNTALLLG